MALTPAEAEAQWRADNPPPLTMLEDGEEREATPAEYEAMAADGGQAVWEDSQRQETEAADQAEGTSIMQTMTALETTADRLDSAEAFTMTQIRHFMAEHMRATAKTMRYINKHSANPVPEA